LNKMGISCCLREALQYAEQNEFALTVGILVLVITLVIYWVAIYPYNFLSKYGIPHPDYHYFIGNLYDLYGNGALLRLQTACIKKYGKVFGFYMGRRAVIVVADASMLEKLLVKDFSNFHNRYGFVGMPKKPMEMCLLMADYPDWKRIRTTVSPTFSLSKIKQTVPLVVQSVNTLVDIFEKSASKETVEVFGLYGRLTMEVILSVAFGLQTNFQVEGDETITKEAMKFFTARRSRMIIELLPLPKYVKDRLKWFANSDPAFFLRILKPAVEERRRNPKTKQDFLQLVLSENKVDGKQKLSDDDIYANSITFLLAGYETTSNALAYTTYLLALHPDIQQRLYEELKANIPDSEDENFYEAVYKLDYLDAVLNESLRMYPPAWQTGRMSEEQVKLGNYTIPAKTSIQIPIYSIHHCEDYWPDHLKFDPERFSPENRSKIHPYHFMPFGHGPRNCIGMRFALTEAKITLAKVLLKFRFEKTVETEEHPLELRFGITISPKNGVNVKIVKRDE